MECDLLIRCLPRRDPLRVSPRHPSHPVRVGLPPGTDPGQHGPLPGLVRVIRVTRSGSGWAVGACGMGDVGYRHGGGARSRLRGPGWRALRAASHGPRAGLHPQSHGAVVVAAGGPLGRTGNCGSGGSRILSGQARP